MSVCSTTIPSLTLLLDSSFLTVAVRLWCCHPLNLLRLFACSSKAVWRLVDANFAYHAHHIAYRPPPLWDVRSRCCTALMPVACSYSEKVVIVQCAATELSPYEPDNLQQGRALK